MGEDNIAGHLSGLEEPGMRRDSAWAGNGMGRVDKVDKKTSRDCHMEREPAGKDEIAAKDGKIASHRFLGAHTWMAGMRGDTDTPHRLQAKLEGVASIDIAGAFTEDATRTKQWALPADAMAVAPGQRV